MYELHKIKAMNKEMSSKRIADLILLELFINGKDKLFWNYNNVHLQLMITGEHQTQDMLTIFLLGSVISL